MRRNANVDSLQPTMIHEPSPPAGGSISSPNSLDVSRGQVGFVAGKRAQFADETAALLHKRLAAAALVVAVVMALAFGVYAVRGETRLWSIRIPVLLVVVGAAVALRHKRSWSLPQLRVCELVVFGLVVFQLSLMFVNRFAEFGRNLSDERRENRLGRHE